jgi:hypothetical protein
METKKFEKIKKKFALNNSYFKNRRPQDPATPLECLEYLIQHNELPYKDGLEPNWEYKCFIEHQKRTGVVNDQYFTPPNVAKDMASVFFKYVQDPYCDILEPFCGYGQIWDAIENEIDYFFRYIGFDIDKNLICFAEKTKGYMSKFFLQDFREYVKDETNAINVISNPPYELKLLTSFLFELPNILEDSNQIAVLLLPQGFIHKKTKAIQETMSKFEVIVENRYDSKTFAHTRVLTEIVVLKLK